MTATASATFPILNVFTVHPIVTVAIVTPESKKVPVG